MEMLIEQIIKFELRRSWSPGRIGVARIFDWGGPKPSKIRREFWAEIGNSNDFSVQIQVISKKKIKKKGLHRN